VQDAAAWLTLAVALALAPWPRFWSTLDLPQPEPPGAFVAAGAALAAVAVAHGAGRIAGGGRAAVNAAIVADVLGAAVLAGWLLVAAPADGTLGTIILAATAVGLALQAVFDVLMLRGRST
jgi:hypothetical protein